MKRTQIIICLVSLCMILNHAATAQTNGNGNKKNSTDFFGNTIKYTKYPQQFIKIRPFGIITGKLPVYFENMQSSRFGYEVGAGITFRNYLFQESYEADPDFTNKWRIQNTSYIWPIPSDSLYDMGKIQQYAPTTYQAGFMVSGAVKYYFDAYAHGTSYISLLADYRLGNSSVPSYQQTAQGSYIFDGNDPIKQSITTTNISLNIGQRYNTDRLVIDFYVGAGTRFIEKQTGVFGESYLGKPINGMRIYTSSNVIIFTSGLCVGIPTQQTLKKNK